MTRARKATPCLDGCGRLTTSPDGYVPGHKMFRKNTDKETNMNADTVNAERIRAKDKARLLAMWRIAWGLGIAGFDNLASQMDMKASAEAMAKHLTFDQIVGEGGDQQMPGPDDWKALV